MRTLRLMQWLCVALAICLAPPASARGRLFKSPEDEFAAMRRRATAQVALERAIEREADLDSGDDDEDPMVRIAATKEDRAARLDRAPRRPAPRHPSGPRHASGPPNVGFIPRTAALTVSWFTAPTRFTYNDWKTAGVFVSIPLVLILSGFDDTTFQLLTDNHTPSKDRLFKRLDEFGRVPVAAGVLAGFGAYGLVFDDPRGVHTLESGLIATALAGGLTTALKYATGRIRPTAGLGSKQFKPFGGDMSFPSGHTTVAFTLAGVINYHYPGWIGRLALLGACGTGYARVYNLHHWPTDVIFAAMISTATATYVSRMNLAAAKGDLTIEPLFGDEQAPTGLALRRRF